jgi:hypothetical protein
LPLRKESQSSWTGGWVCPKSCLDVAAKTTLYAVGNLTPVFEPLAKSLRGAYNILVRRPEGRRPLGRPRRRWEDNIKMDLREIGFGDVDWIHWDQDRDRWRALVNTVMNLRVP